MPDKVRPPTDTKKNRAHKAAVLIMNKSDLFEIVTQKTILETGVVPWQIPWKTKNGMPRNLCSNRPYTGINFWMLLCIQFESPFYLTFDQARALSRTVRKGEKSTLDIF